MASTFLRIYRDFLNASQLSFNSQSLLFIIVCLFVARYSRV